MGRMSTYQYSRLVHEWVAGISLQPQNYGTRSRRRAKASIIYEATGNLQSVQFPLGHAKIDSRVRYLGVGVEGAPVFPDERRSQQTQLWTHSAPLALPNSGHSFIGSRSHRSFAETT